MKVKQVKITHNRANTTYIRDFNECKENEVKKRDAHG
jgi:hypothetical protein